MEYSLAEFNVARFVRPLDHAENAEFVAALEPINSIAEASPGFIWRLTTEDGAASTHLRIPEVDDPLTIINLSVWEDFESLQHYTTRSGHSSYLRRRREWFERPDGPTVVCWWIPADAQPTPADGVRRLKLLASDGPSEEGWPLMQPFARPDVSE